MTGKRVPLLLLVMAGMGLFVAAAAGQVAEEVNEIYQSHEGREQMLGILSAPDRAETLQAEKLIASLDIVPGSTVVDLGTGAGFLLPLLSEAVGSEGVVIAQDIYQDFLDAARQTAEAARVKNVEFLLGNEKDPMLPEDAVDLVIVVDAYHHFSYPAEMLAGIRRGLNDSGRLAILDYYKSGFRDPKHIRLDKLDVVREIVSNGFRLLSNRDHVPGTQYLLQFAKSE